MFLFLIFFFLLLFIIIKFVKVTLYNPTKGNDLLNTGNIQTYEIFIDSTIPGLGTYYQSEEKENILARQILWNITGIDTQYLNTILMQTLPGLNTYENVDYGVKTLTEINPSFLTEDTREKTSSLEQDEEFIYQPHDSKKSETKVHTTYKQLHDFSYLSQNIYTIDRSMKLSMADFDMDYYLDQNLYVNLQDSKPKILIFHTHSQEDFVDTTGSENSIVGVGNYLTQILEDQYHIHVLHHTKSYDVVNGALQRNGSYERVEPAVRKILQENPSIEVLIDIHRDGIPEGQKLITTVNGKPTAKFMFFNGICKLYNEKTNQMEPISNLPNPYIKDNMALSFQMQLMADELYPGLTRKIYLKQYRYSLHMKPKSLMVEVGAQTNTFEEAKNAMEPLAEILYKVLSGEKISLEG